MVKEISFFWLLVTNCEGCRQRCLCVLLHWFRLVAPFSNYHRQQIAIVRLVSTRWISFRREQLYDAELVMHVTGYETLNEYSTTTGLRTKKAEKHSCLQDRRLGLDHLCQKAVFSMVEQRAKKCFICKASFEAWIRGSHGYGQKGLEYRLGIPIRQILLDYSIRSLPSRIHKVFPFCCSQLQRFPRE